MINNALFISILKNSIAESRFPRQKREEKPTFVRSGCDSSAPEKFTNYSFDAVESLYS